MAWITLGVCAQLIVIDVFMDKVYKFELPRLKPIIEKDIAGTSVLLSKYLVSRNVYEINLGLLNLRNCRE